MGSRTRTMKKIALRILIPVAILAAIIQVYPVNRKNPPVTQDVGAPANVATILRTSCYDCHSNKTRWPLYSYIAPVSWLVAADVRKGRLVLNFSRWDTYTKARQDTMRDRCYALASASLMPLPNYLLIHKDARLDSIKIEALRRWSLAQNELHN